ncbi:MAG: hypothetical protein SF182_20810 [Deltaproteobacteria bacterium]|nr:hypothetical protein [Deltaproteobacteria bacterium]
MNTVASCAAALALCLAVAGRAAAITITYVNVGPADSRVCVGFANDASGNLTSDLVVQPSAASRNDTVYGPLPPPLTLPSFDAMAYAAAELGTNLNAPLGTGVRSVFAPLNLTFFQAHGETLAASGSYSSQAFAFSGNTTSTAPTHWVVHVDPSGSETAGTPADVTITGSISGSVAVAGSSLADASWQVATAGFGTVMSGTASQSTPGSTGFSDGGTLTFTLPLGSTFDLLVDYQLSASGSGAGADSTSEVAASLVQISAVLTPPAMFAPVSGLKLLMQDRYAGAGRAKALLVLKDATPGSIAKGAAAAPPGLTGTVELYQVANPANRAVYDLAAAGWSRNGTAAAKYVNGAAASGGAGAKKLLIKPDKALKFLAANLGDGDAASGDQGVGDLDLTALTASDSIRAVVTIVNAADSSTHRMCAQFDSPAITPIMGGSGLKLLSTTASLPVSCP